MANFKQIVAMCLDGASYAQITHALGCQLGCSRREVSRAKMIIAEESLSLETFRQLPPEGSMSDSAMAAASAHCPTTSRIFKVLHTNSKAISI